MWQVNFLHKSINYNIILVVIYEFILQVDFNTNYLYPFFINNYVSVSFLIGITFIIKVVNFEV